MVVCILVPSQGKAGPTPVPLPPEGAHLPLLYGMGTGPESKLHLNALIDLGCQEEWAGGPTWPLHPGEHHSTWTVCSGRPVGHLLGA